MKSNCHHSVVRSVSVHRLDVSCHVQPFQMYVQNKCHEEAYLLFNNNFGTTAYINANPTPRPNIGLGPFFCGLINEVAGGGRSALTEACDLGLLVLCEAAAKKIS